jgi:hypothetical protein
MDDLTAGQTIGYIVGGIVSDAQNGGNTAASNLIFEVVYQPVPEPRTLQLVAVAAALACVTWWVIRVRRRAQSS